MSSYVDIPINYQFNQAQSGYSVRAKVSPDNVDAFARLRVSNPQTIFDSKQIADNQPLFWDDAEVSGAGTATLYNTNQASTTISVSASTAGKRVRQSRRWLAYQPGKSQQIIMTAVMSGNATKRLGQFTDDNGVFFGHSTTFHVGVRTSSSGSPVDTIIPQSEWNVDKMDGTGASKITLDATKTNIYFIDYEWLGVGTIRYGVFYNGSPFYVHAINNANVNTVVYMSTPNLPLRYEITNSGTNGASSLTHICTTVVTEGGREETGVVRGLNRATNTLITLADNDIYPLIGFRLKSTNLGAFIKLLSTYVICSSSATYAFYIKLNPTVAGTTPTWISLTNSSIEYAFPTNATKVSGGTDLYSGIMVDTNQSIGGFSFKSNSDLTVGSDIAGDVDECYICVQVLAGTTETFYGALNFSETN